MALSGIQRTFADTLNSIWGKDAQTSIPTQPVSGIAYRDTEAEFESGQKYDSLGESSRWNQLLYLLTGLMSELTAFGILPWSAAQPYSKGALCIGSNGALWQAQIDIVPNPANPVVPGTDVSVWASPEIPGTVRESRRVIAGSGLTGGGTLSEDITLAVLTDKVTAAVEKGAITVKDVAIGGAASDLASKRGQIGNVPPVTITDFNTFTTSGRYFATWNRATAKNIPPDGTNGLVIVSKLQTANVVRQIVFRWGTAGTNDWQIFTRESTDANGVLLWSPWRWIVTDQSLGDGLRFSGGKLSVPEYVGATASAPGTSGLVPPAAARERESFLTGSGKYKPALSTSGGTITGELNIAAPAGGSEGGEITLINGTDGKYPAKIDTTRNLIRFFGGPSNPVSVDLETGRFVGNLTGKADTAGIADSALAFANGRRWVEVIYEGNPGWLIGSEKEELRPVNPSSLNVNYANSAGTANINLHDIRYYGSQDSITLPAGGTWLVWWVRNTTQVNGGMGTYAGGATVTPGQTNNYYCIRIA
ncbi:pyocin knob domain-containing protein [uncultured Bilophila sp.]|uniref:pyocin knob domain-containing protein n=4 Tax=uncultured Bilophila sp. TaxID=529385 RepID=UPI0025F90D05|nr:pyocin knob domain-containing protein [uncultured Bilophila sp.]